MAQNPTKSLIFTFIGIAIFLFVTRPDFMGGLMAVLFVLLWLPYTLVNGILSRKQWRIWLMKLACWLMAFGILYAMHHVYNENARAFAQKVVDDLHIYHAQNGHYPKTETWKAQQNQPIPYRLRYFCLDDCQKNQRPPLVEYSSSVSPFDLYVYDFEKKEWEFRPD